MGLRETLIAAAEALEKQAAEMDAAASQKTAAVAAEREALVAKVAQRYEDATGETLSTEDRAKLASTSDPGLLNVLEKVASRAEGVGGLGEAASEKRSSDTTHLSKAERAQQAWDRFGDWINGGSSS